MSNEGDARGPRASVYINAALGRAGKRTFVHGKHATVMHWLMYDWQMGAPHTMLATDAAAAKKGKASVGAQESGIRINIEWTFGVPRVNGMFGHPSVQTFEPSFVMNEKGGMEGGGFEQFIRLQIFVAFPNMQMEWEMSEDGTEVIKGPVFMQFDAGPDRYSEMSLSFRIECYQRGLILFPGLINGTAANQVCDDLFGVYKTSSAAVMDQIVAEKIAVNALDPAIKVLPPPARVCLHTHRGQLSIPSHPQTSNSSNRQINDPHFSPIPTHRGFFRESNHKASGASPPTRPRFPFFSLT